MPVIKITSKVAVTYDAAIGATLRDFNAQEIRDTENPINNGFSPCAVKVGTSSINYRVVYIGDTAWLMRVNEMTDIKPVPDSGIDPAAIVAKRDSEWIKHLTPP
jgi:hypothetical protein